MKSLAKALIIICSLVLAAWMAYMGHVNLATYFFLFACAVTAFYEIRLK